MDELTLDAVDQRILGSLMEKRRTVPASYPLTLNALRGACNQTSSREPVVDYDDQTLQDALRTLKERGLVRIVWADRGPRTLKYHQTLDEALSLQPDERALVTVLLLRGPQAPGALRARTERLHPFTGREQVEAVLRRMATLPTPLVRELERRPGQQDRRWAHLLGPEPTEPASTPAAGADLESVLAQGRQARDAKVVESYDVLAPTYAERLSRELERKPFDVLKVTSRRALEAEARQDPIAHGTLLALAVAALVALGLALTGILLTVLGDLRDERGELFDLEAEGAAPRLLRRIVRLRALTVALAGLLAGALTGLALGAVVTDLVSLTARATAAEPPLRLAVDWTIVGWAVAAYALAALALVVLATRNAFPNDGAPGRVEAIE